MIASRVEYGREAEGVEEKESLLAPCASGVIQGWLVGNDESGMKGKSRRKRNHGCSSSCDRISRFVYI